MKSFLDALNERVLVCDGAMGTMLYSKGVFINRSFEELNVVKPDLVREVHAEYVKAGADILETNTYGGNRFKLRSHGLEEQLRAINLAGVQVAREAAGDRAFVAGAIGPLGARVEPWGKISLEEARQVFGEQTAVLLEGGVDLFILETFSDLNEIHAAIQGVRDVSGKPLVAQMTVEDDGHSLEGTPPEVFARKLEEWGVDVIGLNCSVGPQVMFDMIERISSATSRKLSAQPNAGKPRNVEGRNIYLCSPDYMASYARKFAQAGVRIVGGCCGTTPQHIKAMRAAVRSMETTTARPALFQASSEQRPAEAVPREQRSQLARKLLRGEFVRLVDMLPPKGHEAALAVESAKYLHGQGVDAVNIPEAPKASARMSAVAAAVLIENSARIETVVHYSCRDRNLLGMQADLLGAYALGLRNVVLVTGGPIMVDYPDATAVYDVDSIGLTNMVHRLNHGMDVGGKSIGKPTGFLIGVETNPGAINLDEELKRFYYKVEAGADFVVTAPVFDVELLARFIRKIEGARLPIIASIWRLASYENAESLRNEIPDSAVPQHLIERMKKASTPAAARAEGIRIAQETLMAIQGMVQGVQVSAPSQTYDAAVEALSVVSTKGVV